MEHADELTGKNTSLSELITSECRLLPKSHNPFSDRFNSYIQCEFEYLAYCGSTMEFYIRPLNTCIDDVDALVFRADHLAFKDDFPVLPLDVSVFCDSIECYKIESCLNNPGFVRLRDLGSMNYNWICRKYEFIPATLIDRYRIFYAVGEATLMKLKNNVRFGVQSHTVRGPAIKIHMHAQNAFVDYVQSMWCPQWPREAQRWPKRPRKHGWPTKATISKIVQNGCHIVYMYLQHCDSRDDREQWRLSFSIAEVILLQSWTQIQQIVYHLLRFFAKRELIQKDCPKEDEVLCTYHLKTLMLWTCEEMSPEWWNSNSVIAICCELLIKLLDWLKRRHCPNYFITEANLFHDLVGSKMVDKIERRLYAFCSPDTLCDWFECNYIRPIAQEIENLREARSTSHLIECRKAVRGLSLHYFFVLGFTACNTYTCTLINSEDLHMSAMRFCLNYMCWTRKFAILQNRNMSLIPIPDSVWCLTYFDATLHILHTLHGLDCEKITWHSEIFIKFIEGISLKHKIVLCYHHIYPIPFRAERSRSQFLKAQEFLLNLTVSDSPFEFQLFSLLSKELLRKALDCNDSQSSVIVSAALTYVAALHFAASEIQVVRDLCTTILMDQTGDAETETLNAGCLFFNDDVVRIVGFCLLCKRLNNTMMYTRKHIYLDLRLTPKVFACYLLIASTKQTSKQLQLNFDLSTSQFPFDQFIFIMIKRKLHYPMNRPIGKFCLNAARQCVYRRADLLTSRVTLAMSPFLVKDKLIVVLMDYALENMTSFYNVIRKDFDIHCNTVDCYRALYLYKCCKYDEAMQLCEHILREPDLEANFRKFAFMNVLLLPPLYMFFDRDLQSLLGFHTLCCYQSPLNDDMSKTGASDSETTFANFFARQVSYGKKSISESLRRFSFIRCYYFIGRHFLATYLKLRCCADCRYPIKEAMDEFAVMKLSFPFEHMIRLILMQKLQSCRKISETETEMRCCLY